MKILFTACVIVLLSAATLRGQTQSVAIGTATTNPKAVLLLQGSNQGLIIPIVPNLAAVGAAASEKGMVVFDDQTKTVNYYDGTQWVAASGGSGSGPFTLAISSGSIELKDNGTTISSVTITGGDITTGLLVNGLQGTALPPIPPTVGGYYALVWNDAPLPTGQKWELQVTAGSTTGNLTSPTIGVTIGNGNGAVLGTGTTISIQNATAAQPGLLTAADFTTFNGKASVAGDLSGTAASPTVSKIRGTNVSATAPTANQVLQYNSGTSQWEPTTIAAALGNLDGLSDVTVTAPTDAQILIKNGAGDFTNRSISGDIGITNTGAATVSNTAATGANLITSINSAAAATINTARLNTAVVLDSESPAAGDITGSYTGGLQIGAGAVTNTEIANVDAGKITSGTLGVVRGGTGATAVPTNGQVLVGNTSVYAPVSLSGDVLSVSAAGAVTLANSAATRTNLGLGALATLATVNNALITDVAGSKVTGITANTIPVSNATATGLTASNMTYVSASSRIGINVATPNGTLHVNGAAGQNGNVVLSNAATGSTNADGGGIGFASGSSDLTIENLENANIVIRNNGATRYTINNNGAIGIGAVPDFGTSGQVLTSAGSTGAPTWNTIPVSISPANTVIRGNALGLAQVASSITDDGLFTGIGRSLGITANERFGFTADYGAGNFGGMYINSNATGKPFYGYSTGSIVRGYTYIDGADSYKWKLYNGGDRITVQSDGAVGLGTTTPSTELELSALSPVFTIRTTGVAVTESASLQFVNGSGTVLGSIGDPGSSSNLQLSTPTFMTFNTNGAVRQTIASTGNVSIGAPTSGIALDVAPFGNWNLTSTEGDFRVGNGTYRLKMGVATSGGGAGDAYINSQGGTNRLFLGTAVSTATSQTMTLSGGFVGIGTNSPASPFQVLPGSFIPGAGNGDSELFHNGGQFGSGILSVSSSGGDGTGTLYATAKVAGIESNPSGSNNFGVWGHQWGTGAGGWGVIASNGASATAPDTYVALGGSTYALRIVDGNQANGYVLKSDASGNAAWAPVQSIAFSAFNGVTQNLAAGWNQIQFPTEEYDLSGNYASNQMVVPANGAGLYHFIANVNFNSTIANSRYQIAIYKNGSTFKSVDYFFTGSNFSSVHIDCDLLLAAGDIITAWVYCQNADVTFGNSTYVYFQGRKVN